MSTRTDTAARFIPASPKRLFEAFADPASLVRWLAPSGMRGRVEVFEPRAGGRYRLALTYVDAPDVKGKSSADTDVVEGTFDVWEPDLRIVQRVNFESDDPAFAGEMTLRWEFQPAEGGARVTLVAAGVPGGITAADHQAGMNSTLENLAAFVSAHGNRAT